MASEKDQLQSHQQQNERQNGHMYQDVENRNLLDENFKDIDADAHVMDVYLSVADSLATFNLQMKYVLNMMNNNLHKHEVELSTLQKELAAVTQSLLRLEVSMTQNDFVEMQKSCAASHASSESRKKCVCLENAILRFYGQQDSECATELENVSENHDSGSDESENCQTDNKDDQTHSDMNTAVGSPPPPEIPWWCHV